MAWSSYAQSRTDHVVKGMLTGPVTILNWSWPREDVSNELQTRQLALAIRDEVLDLERAGIRVIQIDEAALREKLPLRKSDWHKKYLDWAIPASGSCTRPCSRPRRSTPTCAIRSSTTSSATSTRWTPT